MKKSALILLPLILSTSAFAELSVNCSEAADSRNPKVTITQTAPTGRVRLLTLTDAAKTAFSRCFIGMNRRVRDLDLEAAAAARQQVSAGVACKPMELRIMTLSSWVSGRTDIHGSSGGDATFLVQRPYLCGPDGTGLFTGIAAASYVQINVGEARLTQGDKTTQTFSAVLLKDEVKL